MPERPYLLVLEATISASSTATVSYPMPTGEGMRLHKLVFNSTGTFNVTDIRDSAGRHYCNASVSTEIPSGVLASGANAYNAISEFVGGIEIEPGLVFYVDLEDSSGASNTVTLVFSGVRYEV